MPWFQPLGWSGPTDKPNAGAPILVWKNAEELVLFWWQASDPGVTPAQLHMEPYGLSEGSLIPIGGIVSMSLPRDDLSLSNIRFCEVATDGSFLLTSDEAGFEGLYWTYVWTDGSTVEVVDAASDHEPKSTPVTMFGNRFIVATATQVGPSAPAQWHLFFAGDTTSGPLPLEERIEISTYTFPEGGARDLGVVGSAGNWVAICDNTTLWSVQYDSELVDINGQLWDGGNWVDKGDSFVTFFVDSGDRPDFYLGGDSASEGAIVWHAPELTYVVGPLADVLTHAPVYNGMLYASEAERPDPESPEAPVHYVADGEDVASTWTVPEDWWASHSAVDGVTLVTAAPGFYILLTYGFAEESENSGWPDDLRRIFA